MTLPLISYHGSHSGEFCTHADACKLEEVVQARIKKGFTHFGLSEHQFIDKQEFLYREDREAGMSVDDVFRSFSDYIKEARRLQQEYHNQAHILVGLETEVYDETSFTLINHIRQQFEPDYIVGSLHYVGGIGFDTNQDYYNLAIRAMGSLENLYQQYYELQFELIEKCHPEVIGHFDLIKIFSKKEENSSIVWQLIERNIKAVINYGGVFEVNTRSFKKGLQQPYPNEEILSKIAEMGGEITLGDDSHSVAEIGYAFQRAEKVVTKYFNYLVAFEKSGDKLEKIRLPIK